MIELLLNIVNPDWDFYRTLDRITDQFERDSLSSGIKNLVLNTTEV